MSEKGHEVGAPHGVVRVVIDENGRLQLEGDPKAVAWLKAKMRTPQQFAPVRSPSLKEKRPPLNAVRLMPPTEEG